MLAVFLLLINKNYLLYAVAPALICFYIVQQTKFFKPIVFYLIILVIFNVFFLIFCILLTTYPGSAGKETEILLLTPPSVVSHIEDLRNSLISPCPVPMVRGSIHDFVCQYKNPDYYLSRCFPTLYPYGRGCPSDKWCKESSGIVRG